MYVYLCVFKRRSLCLRAVVSLCLSKPILVSVFLNVVEGRAMVAACMCHRRSDTDVGVHGIVRMVLKRTVAIHNQIWHTRSYNYLGQKIRMKITI